MHRRAIALLIITLPLLLSACDIKGLPISPTATSIIGAMPTATSAEVSQLPSKTTVAATAAPTSARMTSTAQATAQAGGTVMPQVSTGDPATDQVLLQVELDAIEVRGLKPKEDVPELVINREQLRANLIESFKEDYSQEEARQDAIELWLLRFSNTRTLDLYQLFLDLYTEQIAGYYDPEKNEMYILSESTEISPSRKETLAHEFVHSLQDQHYDLEKMLPDESTDDDRNRAVRSLVEGDATVAGVMYAYQYLSPEEFQKIIEESGKAPSAVLNRVPTYIKEDLLFPYTEGSAFVTKLIERGGYQRVNAAFADPPQSTEQIIHPEKYIQLPRDEPIPVVIPPLTSTLGAGWTYRDGYTFGEFDLRELLKENGANNADKAAAGWGGGQTAFYENDESALYVVDTRWDTQDEAVEFEQALRSTFARSRRVGELWSDGEGARFFGIISSGDRVALISATDQKTVETAMSALK